MIETAVVNLDDTFEKLKFERFMSFVSTEKRERIRRFLRYEDALRTLIGDILVRYLLCQRLKMKNQNIKFEVNQYGKPFFANHKSMEFNISHSGIWVACSIDNNPVGIDIELIKPINMKIAERFFSKDEIKNLAGKSIFDREAYFYDLWTLKESYVKAIGKGLLIPLDSFTISINEENHINVHSNNNLDKYYFRQYCIHRDYKMAVCSTKNNFPNYVRLINVNDLYNEVLLL